MSEDTKPDNRQALLHAALAKAQGAFGPIVKNRSVTIRSEKGSYAFRYADMEELIAKTRPALAANGLAVAQSVGIDQQGQGYIETMLLHADGGVLGSRLPVPKFTALEDPKKFGAVISYVRRYEYGAILCLAADDDLDEDGEEARDPAPPARKQPARKQPAAEAPPADEQQPAAPRGDAAEPGEIAWVKKKLAALQLKPADIGLDDVESMTKSQFASAKADLLKR